MAEQKNYALTIAIPTYNRLEKLKICLKRLMEQKKIEQIEIIVSDNASTDGTGEYMTELVKKAENIHYYRNTENVGPDKNFLNCFEKAVGEYVLCWEMMILCFRWQWNIFWIHWRKNRYFAFKYFWVSK